MASAKPPMTMRTAFNDVFATLAASRGWAWRSATPPALLRLMRLLAGGQRDLRHPPAIECNPGVFGDRVGVGVTQRLMGGNAILIAAGNLVAFLIRQDLLDSVGLLNVGRIPIPDPLPRGIGVGTEDELACAGRYFEQLRAGSVCTEGRMDLDARKD